jgi:beta-mannosidase
VLGEWRRAGSPCRGALVLWLRDLAPGSGWGVLDHRGDPKPAWQHLRRALAPVAVWTSDERLDGVRIHVANDRAAPLDARLRVALYRGEHRVEEAIEPLALAGHDTLERDVEAMLGRFVDAAWAYRFGPPGHDAIVASLERDGADGPELLSQAVRFPARRSVERAGAPQLGLEATAEPAGDDVRLHLRARRLVDGLRLHAPGFEAADDAFALEPGRVRTVLLRRRGDAAFAGARLTALNLAGSLEVGR